MLRLLISGSGGVARISGGGRRASNITSGGVAIMTGGSAGTTGRAAGATSLFSGSMAVQTAPVEVHQSQRSLTPLSWAPTWVTGTEDRFRRRRLHFGRLALRTGLGRFRWRRWWLRITLRVRTALGHGQIRLATRRINRTASTIIPQVEDHRDIRSRLARTSPSCSNCQNWRIYGCLLMAH